MAAESILERWSKLAGYGVRTGPRKGEYRALRELGTLALATLSGDPETNPIVLQNILRLLRFERTFAPIFARYLGERDDAAMLLDAFDKLLKSRAYLNGWQAWWLEHTVAKLKQFKSRLRRRAQMGLAINDSKTITCKRGSYETSLHEADALRQRIANEANLNLTQFDYDEYSDDNSARFFGK